MNTTISNKLILLSKKGMNELKKSVQSLEKDWHSAVLKLHELDKTSGHDERLERIERLAQLESIEAKLSDARLNISMARLIPTRRERLKVAIGSVVDLIDQQGRLFRYTLVDSIEANPSDGRISIASPLGMSLVGKTVHDIIEWGNGIREQQLRLVSIN
jgi:transcription elongation factor GreA